MKIMIDAVHCLVNSDWTLNEELADYLRSLDLKIYVITNASPEKISEIIDDFEIFTLENNPPKTDSKYFEAFLEKVGSADDLYYADHLKDNLDSAKSAGITNTFLWTGDLDRLKDWLNSVIPSLCFVMVEPFHIDLLPLNNSIPIRSVTITI